MGAVSTRRTPSGRSPSQPGPTIAKVTGSAPGGALSDVVEVVRGEPGELEGEVALAHVRVRQDHRLVAQVEPGQRVDRVGARRAAVTIRGVEQAPGVPEMVDRRGPGNDLRITLDRHPCVAELAVEDVREAVDEGLHPGRVGVLGPPVGVQRLGRAVRWTLRGPDIEPPSFSSVTTDYGWKFIWPAPVRS